MRRWLVALASLGMVVPVAAASSVVAAEGDFVTLTTSTARAEVGRLAGQKAVTVSFDYSCSSPDGTGTTTFRPVFPHTMQGVLVVCDGRARTGTFEFVAAPGPLTQVQVEVSAGDEVLASDTAEVTVTGWRDFVRITTTEAKLARSRTEEGSTPQRRRAFPLDFEYRCLSHQGTGLVLFSPVRGLRSPVVRVHCDGTAREGTFEYVAAQPARTRVTAKLLDAETVVARHNVTFRTAPPLGRVERLR